MKVASRSTRYPNRNILIAAGVALLVVAVGYILVLTKAAGFFASVDPANTTLSGNASLITQTDGSKVLQFNAPATPPTDPGPLPPGTKPDASNTGVPPGTVLTDVNGDQLFDYKSNGQTISGKKFNGFVTVTGSNITFKNCLFRGRATSTNNALLYTQDSSGPVTVMDSEFVPASPSATIDGLTTRNTSLYRVNVHGSVDGMKANSNTLVQDSYFHDMHWFAVDPNQGGTATHNDAIQTFAGESNVRLIHNNLDMSTTYSANAAWQSSATNSRAEGNWLDGGGCSLNFFGSITNAVVNNRFGRHSVFQCPILLSTQANLSQNSGNVWDDDGTPIPPPQRHD